MNRIILGCIADDVTGATDLANNLVRSGMRVVQTMGVPTQPLAADQAVDAVVVAQKIRTIPAAEAVARALSALAWLREQGAQQIYFKYCSTFDSTAQGNIGPVTDALMDALATDFTIACPAFPEAGRTIYQGYLFVGDLPLNESGMRNHPLTPMTDANLVRVLQAQSRRRVGLIDYRTVKSGSAAIAQRVAALRQQGFGIAIVDALDDGDLHSIAAAVAGLPLVTAGSGVAIGLPGNFGVEPSDRAAQLPPPSGAQAIVSGSCSVATNGQVADFVARGLPAFRVDPLALVQRADGATRVTGEALAWAGERIGNGPILIYTTAPPEAVRAAQASLGVERTGELVEQTLAGIARGLVDRGVRQLIVAGGETSGACVDALGITHLRIGPQVAPGVPWCHAASSRIGNRGLHLALKSGNFGAPDFFTRAFDLIQ